MSECKAYYRVDMPSTVAKALYENGYPANVEKSEVRVYVSEFSDVNFEKGIMKGVIAKIEDLVSRKKITDDDIYDIKVFQIVEQDGRIIGIHLEWEWHYR